MPLPLPISATVDIAAPAERVWELVGDVTRMPEWSPELRRLRVVGRSPVRVGSTLLGLNRRGLVAWPTSSTVTRLDPGRAVAWRTRESGATWTYELTGTGSGAGTRLTSVLGPVIGGAAGHDQELAAGIRTTLERIKAAVEASPAA